jgi:hypothetical protein
VLADYWIFEEAFSQDAPDLAANFLPISYLYGWVDFCMSDLDF